MVFQNTAIRLIFIFYYRNRRDYSFEGSHKNFSKIFSFFSSYFQLMDILSRKLKNENFPFFLQEDL